ncbi:MAG: DUF2088 domain-containing protein [Pirellulales bacterium]|nr:DUF2088 domain-containing protein [Pirellulales bacterium]
MRYGLDASLAVDPSEGALLGQFGSPKVEPVADIQAELRRALAEPLDYPPFSAIITPGDRVVLALSEEVPGLAEIVAATVECLIEGNVDPEAITVLRPAASTGSDPCGLLPEDIRGQVVSLAHAPDERETLAYLATTEQGQAVFLHRAIVDADLVLPLGCFRGVSVAGYYGVHTPIYPAFSDAATLRRFHSTDTLDARGRGRKRLHREVDEVAWLLGIAFAVQVLPAGGDRVHQILAGRADAVHHRGMRLFSSLWHESVPRRVNLVLAALEGDASQQTWENLGRAVETAVGLVEEGGALVLCTELAEPPGTAVEYLISARSRDEALQQIHQGKADDTVTAIQLARALDHCSVYLLSRLDDTLVEDLEMTPVADPKELVRLAGRYESYLLLGNAAYAGITVENHLDG